MPARNPNHGGKRPNSGRKPKIVEDASQSILFELFDESQERATIQNMIAISQDKGTLGRSQAAISAATWLWERKYGKLTDKVESDTKQRIIVEYETDNGNTTETP